MGAATITLGAVSDAAMNNSVSAINVTNGFTLNGTAYREGFSAQLFLQAQFRYHSETWLTTSYLRCNWAELYICRGDGANFSAAMTNVIIEDADWSLTMPELEMV